MNTPILCYVDGSRCYFTTQDLEKQWGDDWNDAPYEYNAGEPYEPIRNGESWKIIKVILYGGDLLVPEEQNDNNDRYNDRYSVEDINGGAVP